MNAGEETRITDAGAALRYTLAGRAVFTLKSARTGVHYTYKVSIAADRRGTHTRSLFTDQANQEGPVRFVHLLTGPDNTGDYTYLGVIRDGAFRLTGKSRMTLTAAPVLALNFALRQLRTGVLPAALEFWHSGRCGRCARLLTVPESVAAGIGPECAAQMF
jgi:hypothetical protein